MMNCFQVLLSIQLAPLHPGGALAAPQGGLDPGGALTHRGVAGGSEGARERVDELVVLGSELTSLIQINIKDEINICFSTLRFIIK